MEVKTKEDCNRRILLLIDDMGQGGAERQMAYLAVLLQKRGYEVRLVRFYNGECAYTPDLREGNIEPECDIKGNNRWRRIWEIHKLVSSWNPRAVIVYKDGTCIGACLAKLFGRFRLIVSERNTSQMLTRSERLKFLCYRLADYIVPNSFSQAIFIKENFTNLIPKVKVITNTLPLDKFKSSEQNFPLRVITTARIAPQKNVENYLKALVILKERGIKAKFDWFGKPHNSEYFQTLIHLQKQLQLEDYIEFHPEGTNKVEEEYRQSTHFCLPSLYEGFPNVLCEAMAAGLVCSASNVCDNPSILECDEFTFDPKNPASIASVLYNSLMCSQTKRLEIGERNRDRIISLCSPKLFINKYIELIEQ